MHKYFLILFAVGILLYLPSLFGNFLWDDEDFVYANQHVAEFRIDKFFTDSQTAGRGKPSNYYRPLPQIAYASVHSVFGFNPFWYHLLNVLVHISAACTIYYFFRLLIKPLSHSLFIAHCPLLIALFFLIHPIQTETVSYISGLSDSLYVFFGMLSLIFFKLKDERKNMLPLSLFFFVLSLTSKETGLVFMPLLLLLTILTKPQSLKTILSTIYKSLITLWSFVLTAIIYLWYHFTYINNFDIKSAWGNNPYANSIVVRLLTFIQNLFLYVQLLIFPRDLFMERDFTIQVQTQILNPYFIGFIIILPLICLIIYTFRTGGPMCPPSEYSQAHTPVRPYTQKLLIFCFAAFFVSFTPYTGIVLINGIFYEHFLYLPLVFFFAFWAILLSSLTQLHQTWAGGTKKILSFGAILICALLIGRNIQRQFEWNSPIRFYKQTLEHAPKSIRIINGLGMAYAEKGDVGSSISTYQHGISVNPKVPNLYHNLANAYASQGNLKQAEENYLKALEIDPNFLFSAQSLANLYQQTNQNEKLKSLQQKYSH